jgi:hypothetical protein
MAGKTMLATKQFGYAGGTPSHDGRFRINPVLSGFFVMEKGNGLSRR